MTRRRLTCALAAMALPLALPGGGAPAAAATSTSTWTVTAASSASTTVVLRKPVVLALTSGAPEFRAQRERNTVVQLSGSYGGLVLRDAEGRVVWSVVAVRELPGAFPVDTSPEADRQVLPAGSYRVDVVGDGRVTVRVPVRGAAPGPVTATRRTEGVQAGTRVIPSGSAPLAQARVPFVAKPGAPVLHVGETRTGGHLATVHSVCFLPPGGRFCATDDEGSGHTVVLRSEDEGPASSWGVTTLLAPGAHQAALDLAGAGGERGAVLFAVALPA